MISRPTEITNPRIIPLNAGTMPTLTPEPLTQALVFYFPGDN